MHVCVCVHIPLSFLSCIDVTVELFGSSLSGFALKDSDVNINLSYKVQGDEKINVSVVCCIGLEHARQQSTLVSHSQTATCTGCAYAYASGGLAM